jgi:hypothetical protein
MMGGAMNQDTSPRMTNPPSNPNQRRQMNGPDLDTFLDDITGPKNVNM